MLSAVMKILVGYYGAQRMGSDLGLGWGVVDGFSEGMDEKRIDLKD